MKRLKTFKQIRRSEGTITDSNAIPMEDIGKKLFNPFPMSILRYYVLFFSIYFSRFAVPIQHIQLMFSFDLFIFGVCIIILMILCIVYIYIFFRFIK